MFLDGIILTMNTIEYLKKTYGYDTPIFLKDIRIGRKSKTAIKQDLYRAAKNGQIKRETNGVYYFPNPDSYFPDNGLGFEEIVEKKYIRDDCGLPGYEDTNTYGYITGLNFLNSFGLSQQVPMTIEITTNNTSCKKGVYRMNGFEAIIRKPKTKITSSNWRTLQFLDMFRLLSLDEVLVNKKKLNDYAKKYVGLNNLNEYLPLYSADTIAKVRKGGIATAIT